MLPNAYLVHSMKNRIRIRVPSKRKSADFFTETRNTLSRFDGVQSVECNPFTGSILIRYDTDLTKLKQFAAHRKLFKIVEHQPRSDKKGSPTQRLSDSLSRVDQKLKESSEGSIDLPTLMGTTLLGLAIAQGLRGNWLPPAWTLVDNALEFFHFKMFQKSEIRRV